MKKLFIRFIPAFIFGLAVAATAHAQVASPNYFRKIGPNVYPISTSSIIGTSTIPGAFSNLNVSGTCTGCGLSSSTGASLSGNNTFTGINALNGSTTFLNGLISLYSKLIAFNTELDYASATTIFASATSTGDYGAYLNSLCTTATTNGSGALIEVPQLNNSFSTELQNNGNCLYKAMTSPGGTILTWTGAQGSTMGNINAGADSHLESAGGYQGFRFRYATSATTTNPTIAFLIGGNSGGFNAFISQNIFSGFGRVFENATNTYNLGIFNNTFTNNGQLFQADTYANSGETVILAWNWLSDDIGGANNCILFEPGSVENAFLVGNTTDNCGLNSISGNTVFVTDDEVENAGQIDGAWYPFTIGSDPSNSFYAQNIQVHNDGTSTANSYPAIFNVGGNVSISNVTVSKNAGALSIPYLVTNDGIGGNENLSICNVTNAGGNAYTAISSSTQNGFPEGSYQGCAFQAGAQGLSGYYLATSTGALNIVNAGGLISQWTNDKGYVSSTVATQLSVTVDSIALLLGSGANVSSTIGFQNNAGIPRASVGYNSSSTGASTDTGSAYLGGAASKGVALYTNNNPSAPNLYAAGNGTGFVGIGTSTPAVLLQVDNGAQSSTIMIGDPTHYGCTEWGTPSGLVYQYATTTTPFIITTTTRPTIACK